MTEANMTERRHEIRQRVLKPGKIMIDKKAVISCTVRSASDHGSRVRIDSIVGVPQEFVLETAGGPRRNARIAWKTATEIGIALD